MDIDGPSATYSLVSGPPGAGVTAAGLFDWVPGAGDIGSNPVTVQVSDGTYTDQTSFTVNVTKRTPQLTWTGPLTGQHSDAVTLKAALSDVGPVPGELVTLAVGPLSTGAVTDATGTATGSVVLSIPGGPATAGASFAGDSYYTAVSTSVPFTVTKEHATVSFSGQFLTLISGATSPVPLSAIVVQEADGTLGTDLSSASVTFAQLGGAVLCTAPVVPSPSIAGTGTASCNSAALSPGSRPVIVSLTGPSYAGPVDVSVLTVAVAVSGTAAGAGQVQSSGRSDFGFQAVAGKKAATGDAVQLFRSGTTVYVVRTTTLGSMSISCTATKPKVCSATVLGSGATTTAVDLVTGVVGSASGSSQLRIDATDAAEPVGGSVPADKYAVTVTGSTTFVLGAPTAQLLISAGNVRVLP